MDCAFNWEYKTVVLINELTQGIKHTKQLRAYLSSVASTSLESTQELLLQKILSSNERSLLILKGSTSGSASQSLHPLPPPSVSSGSASQSLHPLPPPSVVIESPVSVDGSPTSDNKKRSFNDQSELIDFPKRSRKSRPTGTELVRVSAESPGFECPIDDGYSWRKYGLKDILGSTYPRSYYRCAYRHMQNCRAMKQAQRSDDDPTVFEIIYKGDHTCGQVTKSPSFVCPNITESSCQMFGIGTESYLTDIGAVLNLHHSESDHTNMFSANTSTTSSSNMVGDFTTSLGATSKFRTC